MANKGHSVNKTSDEIFDFICTTCDGNGEIVEAVKYCVECQGYCCQACTNIHKTFPVLKTHNLLDASRGNQASNQPPSLPEFPTERCSIHQGKILDLFCLDHDDIVCYSCVATDHKDCPKQSIYSIPDMIGKLFKMNEGKQIQNRLRDIIDSMTALGESTDDKLEVLKVAKEESIEKVLSFQKALEVIFRRAAEASTNEIETRYKELESEILQDKLSIESVTGNLLESEEKLKKAEGNRAQHYVCSKLAEKTIKGTLAFEEKLRNDDHKNLTFTPSQPLMDYVNSLQSIGTVVVTSEKKQNRHRMTASRDNNSQTSMDGTGDVTSKKLDVYRIKESKDINIKVSGDAAACLIISCCLTYDNMLLVTDLNNKKLKRIDIQSMNIVDFCTLDSEPFGVCCISQYEAVVACTSSNKIQFVSIDNKLTPTRHINMSHECRGIATNDNKLYVSDGYSFYIYDTAGNLLKTTSYDDRGTMLVFGLLHVTQTSNIAVSVDGNKLYVCDPGKGILCYDKEGNYLSTYTDSDESGVCGVCVDGRGNVFVVGRNSSNVVQFNEDGKKIGVVVPKQHGLIRPLSVCFHQKLNKLFVTENILFSTMYDRGVVKMYDLY
ncbi:hypothetical protein ACF0H5_011056 [Mactra antiquata]